MAPEFKNLKYKSGAQDAVRKTVASSFRPLLDTISNQAQSQKRKTRRTRGGASLLILSMKVTSALKI